MSVYNAGDYPGATPAAKVNAAIAAAASASVPLVLVPTELLPYDASAVTFNNAVRVVREGGDWSVFDVRAYGARATGLVDDHVAIQAAIDASAAGNPATSGFGGRVVFPAGVYQVTSSLTVHNATQLVGQLSMQTIDYPYCRLVAAEGMNTPIVELGSADSVSISGLTFAGPVTPVTGSKGVHGTNNPGLVVHDVLFTRFGDQGLHLEGGAGMYLWNLFAFACCLVRTGRTDYVGAIDVGGSGLQVTNIYADASVSGSGQAGGGFIAGVVSRTESSSFMDVEGDLAEVGFVVKGNQSRYVNCRGNLTQRHGWIVTGYQNMFSNCLAFDTSMDTANAYNGFEVVSGGLGNLFVGCAIGAHDVGRAKDGFHVTSANDDDTSGTYFSGNRVIGTGVAGSLYNLTGAGGNQYSVHHPHRASGDRGNASVTVTVVKDAETQFFNTPLTANRTVTLSTTGAWNGARFRVVRTTSATGSSTLTVNGKALAPGQWVEVEYSATLGWKNIGFGSV